MSDISEHAPTPPTAWQNFTPQQLASQATAVAKDLREGRIPSVDPVVSFLENIAGALASLPEDIFEQDFGLIRLPYLPEGHFPDDHAEYIQEVTQDLTKRPKRKRRA